MLLYHEGVFFILLTSLITIDITIATDNCTEGFFNRSSYLAADEPEQNCGCYSCIRRCCKPGYIYRNMYCWRSFSDMLKVSVYTNKTRLVKVLDETNSHFVVGVPKCTMFRLNVSVEKFYIQEDTKDVWIPHFKKYYNNSWYCVDGLNEFTPFLCFSSSWTTNKAEGSNTVGMIISMPFLFITFVVYFILPERNVHRRALMNYVLSLLCGYISLVTVQLVNKYTQIPDAECHLLGYAIIFFFIVSFFWMNVMCIDMWLAFSGLRRFSGRKNAEQKKFILFCIYAWGIPILLILLIFLINTYGDSKNPYHPGIGLGKCFVQDGYPSLLYFYLPMAILIVVNVILCILTAVRIQTVKNETSMLKHGDSKRHSYENDKQKFKLYSKLFFAMGINWTMEVISWVIAWRVPNAPAAIWYLTDFANAIYGLFIFFIFVFKKNIWLQLKKRFCGEPSRDTLSTRLSSPQINTIKK